MRRSLKRPWQRGPTEWEAWYLAQFCALQDGLEIEPPWVIFPEAVPWAPIAETWPSKQGVYKRWLRDVFLVSWLRKSDATREAFLLRWQPSDSWRDFLEKMQRSRNLVVVEDRALREALFRGIQEQGLRADFLEVQQLRETELYGTAFIVLNTGRDLDRLYATSKLLYETSVLPGYASLWIRTYSPRSVCSDRQVFRLWAAGDPDTISPGVYDPSNHGEVVREVTRYLERMEGEN